MGRSSVRVKGFSRDTTRQELRQFFEGCGRVADVYFKSGGIAVVQFDDSEDARNSAYELNGNKLFGKRITVDRPRALIRTNFRLIVKNLSACVSWQDLKDYMRKAGDVTYGNAHSRYPNEGVVEFASYSDMRTAIEILDNTELAGQRIRLAEDIIDENGSTHQSRGRDRTYSGNSCSRSPSSSRSISPSGSRLCSRSSIHHASGFCNHAGSTSQRQSRSSSRSGSTGSKNSSAGSDQSRSRSRSQPGRASTVNQQVLDSNDVNEVEDECPSCFSFMNPPISPCTERHCLCSDCTFYVSKCEGCRGVVPKSLINSLQHGQSFKTQFCRYNGQGCDYIGSGMELASHHIICKITTMECPLKFMECSWLGKLPKMPQHCAENHPDNFYIVSKKKFLISNFVELRDRRFDMIFNVFSTFFRCVGNLNKETGEMRIAVYHVGNPLIANQFSFELIIHSKNKNLPAITLGGHIFQMYNYNERFVDHKYIGIKHGYIKRLCQRDGSLHYTISIIEK